MRGWMLDVYPSEKEGEGAVVWVLGEDEQRYRLHQPFPTTFYAAGPAPRLRQAWRFLRQHPLRPHLARSARRELFSAQPLDVLAVETARPAEQPGLFRQLSAAFPDLAFYDADLLFPLRFAARWDAFPLAHCEFETGPGDRLLSLRPLDSPWDLDPEPPPLRVLWMEPDVDPGHREPQAVHLRCGRCSYRLPLQPERPLLINLRAILARHDPDLLLSAWGDTWLLPHLIELSARLELPLPFNRDASQEVVFRPEQSYFSYGQIIYHGRQVLLSGRWHLDTHNASFFDDYGLQGILELARVTCLPVQTAARVSPGTGISAMQILTALRSEILVPWHKQRAEDHKTAMDMIRSDQGGLVYQPQTGLHRDVAELDFISMYPSIMVNFNISPETVETTASTLETAPELERIAPRSTAPGLVPRTLAPLLEKRIAFKTRRAELPAWDPRRKRYKACAAAHKWLLVTCFGYLGYKNARFGRIEAHEAVTAYGREALLRAKEAAEDMGYTVLHMYVDGMWVRRPGAASPADLRPLLDEIARRTGLSIALEGIYRWVAFLGSRLDARVPVANRYFGVFQDGSMKVRGIEARRRDTPIFIAEMQIELIELLGKLGWPAGRGPALALLRARMAALRAGRLPLEKLLVLQRLSRELEEYRSPSPAARAALQLAEAGKQMRPGQAVPFLFTRGEPGVQAWGREDTLDPAAVDIPYYIELLLRAAVTVLEPFGMPESETRSLLLGGGFAQPLTLPARKQARLAPKGSPTLLTAS